MPARLTEANLPQTYSSSEYDFVSDKDLSMEVSILIGKVGIQVANNITHFQARFFKKPIA